MDEAGGHRIAETLLAIERKFETGEKPSQTDYLCLSAAAAQIYLLFHENKRLAAEVERYESMSQLRRFDREGRDVTELTGLWDDDDSFGFQPRRDEKEADRE